MSLTRKKLKALGLTEEQIESVIEDHAETVRSIQNDAEKFKADAEKLVFVQKELNELKKADGDEDEDYKAKYEKEHSDFEVYKTEQRAKEIKAAKERAFREIIKTAGISGKRIDAVLRVSNLEDLMLDENGKAKNGADLEQRIREEFSDFVITETEMGAAVMSPPDGDDARDLGKLDMAAYIAERKKSKKG